MLQHFVGQVLVIHLEGLKAAYTAQDDQESVDALEVVLRRQRTIKGRRDVWGMARPELVDVKFLQQINKAECTLPIANGLKVNLRDGSVLARTREDMFTFECPVSVLPDSDPLVHACRFFSEIMGEDQPTIDWLQKFLGYCLTSDITERILLICWGVGHNGKSTMCELMEIIMKPLYVTCAKEVLMKPDRQRSSNSATPELVRLSGANLVVMAETDKGVQLDVPLVKSITGGDQLSVRQLYGQQFEIHPTFKLIMPTNHKPVFNPDDEAMRNRVRFLPFSTQFVAQDPSRPTPLLPHERHRDAEFVKALKTTHLSEVFTWLVRGARRWHVEGLGDVPMRMQDATQAYMNGMDTVAEFLEECCVQGEGHTCLGGPLHAAYVAWCGRNTVLTSKLSGRDFGVRLKKMGFEVRKSNGSSKYLGLALLNERQDICIS
jgi:putative DNA primase/helicase